jgi:hypothetical protein
MDVLNRSLKVVLYLQVLLRTNKLMIKLASTL